MCALIEAALHHLRLATYCGCRRHWFGQEGCDRDVVVWRVVPLRSLTIGGSLPSQSTSVSWIVFQLVFLQKTHVGVAVCRPQLYATGLILLINHEWFQGCQYSDSQTRRGQRRKIESPNNTVNVMYKQPPIVKPRHVVGYHTHIAPRKFKDSSSELSVHLRVRCALALHLRTVLSQRYGTIDLSTTMPKTSASKFQSKTVSILLPHPPNKTYLLRVGQPICMRMLPLGRRMHRSTPLITLYVTHSQTRDDMLIRIVLAESLFGAVGLAIVKVVAKEGLLALVAVRRGRLRVAISPYCSR